VGDSPAEPAGDAGTGTGGDGRPRVGWRGRITSLLTGLAGVAAITGVVAAAAWIRGLDARALLPRYASWLFLVPAAAAAFSSRSGGGLLTVIAIALTAGAVLMTTSLAGRAKGRPRARSTG
jgi:hypothetical protein